MSYRERVLEIVARVSGEKPSNLAPETELVANLGFDSAKALELLVELEDDLGVELSDEDLARLNTVGDILAILEKLV